MDEYVDREAVKNAVTSHWTDCSRILEAVLNIPAADVAPVVHGRWEYDQNATDWGIGGYVCSVCKNKNNNLPCSRVKSVSFFSGAKYCPNCGARMDGE